MARVSASKVTLRAAIDDVLIEGAMGAGRTRAINAQLHRMMAEGFGRYAAVVYCDDPFESSLPRVFRFPTKKAARAHARALLADYPPGGEQWEDGYGGGYIPPTRIYVCRWRRDLRRRLREPLDREWARLEALWEREAREYEGRFIIVAPCCGYSILPDQLYRCESCGAQTCQSCGDDGWCRPCRDEQRAHEASGNSDYDFFDDYGYGGES